MFNRTISLTPFLAIGLIGCSGTLDPIQDLPRALSQAEMQVIEASNDFAFNLMKEVDGQDTTGGNLFISPLSVSMALGMTMNGADGNTRAQMENMLGFGGMSETQINEAYRDLIGLLLSLDPRVETNLANSIWYRDGWTFERTFLQTNLDYFDARVEALDFTDPNSVNTINGWVNQETRGKIPTIIESIPGNMVMYLINAVYFKGSWVYEFDKDRTAEGPFFREDGTSTQVPMMSHADEVDVLTLGTDVANILEMPYGGGAYRMTVVLPHENVGIDSVMAVLDSGTWNDWTGRLDSTRVTVVMPKFTFEYESNLNTVLQTLGMQDAFNSSLADLSRMHASAGLFVSEVIHKTFVDVNEEGTEAAAATSVGIVETSLPPQFAVNRPFLFAIRENFSGTILFIGKMMDPGL
ncbi:MAG: serpin family protein [Gemmatimonadota bacterium]|nr:serpin family protein [Gemmatimonadota bacterium]